VLCHNENPHPGPDLPDWDGIGHQNRIAGPSANKGGSTHSPWLAEVAKECRVAQIPPKPVNEFYQKGCQEKSSASTGGEMFSRDPAHGE